MDKKNVSDIARESVAICFKSKEEYKAFLSVCESLGIMWTCGQKPTEPDCIKYYDAYTNYKVGLCNDTDLHGVVCGLSSYSIITFEDFVDIVIGLTTLDEVLKLKHYSTEELCAELKRRE